MALNDGTLESRLLALQIDSKIVDFPKSYPDLNPVDIYRCYLSEKLARISGVDANTIYAGLQWTQSLDKGDLNQAIPRLRVKRHVPDELAQIWAENVSMTERAKL
jgi:arginyl-tRNA synthetase